MFVCRIATSVLLAISSQVKQNQPVGRYLLYGHIFLLLYPVAQQHGPEKFISLCSCHGCLLSTSAHCVASIMHCHVIRTVLHVQISVITQRNEISGATTLNCERRVSGLPDCMTLAVCLSVMVVRLGYSLASCMTRIPVNLQFT